MRPMRPKKRKKGKEKEKTDITLVFFIHVYNGKQSTTKRFRRNFMVTEAPVFFNDTHNAIIRERL